MVDVRSSEQVNLWIEKTVQDHGRLDGAANIAGVHKHLRTVKEETDEGWDFVIDTNARGTFYCLRAELNHMDSGGSIVSLTAKKPMRQIALPR